MGAFFTGDAEFQTFHGILARLKQRGHLNLRTYAYSRFLRQQPHCKEFFHHADIRPTILLKRIFEWFPKRWLKEIDALLVIQDPLRDRKNPRRCKYITESNFTTIYLAHAVIPNDYIQRRILDRPELVEFHSSLIFEYEKLPESRLIYSAETLAKIRQSGIIKKFHITPEASKYADILAKFPKTILFTHEFRTKGRFSSTQMLEYFQMVKIFARENPSIALILRPHRGRAKEWHKKLDTELQQKCSNVFFANHNSGLFKGALVNDLLKNSHALVSTSSTAIVDACYMDVPVAVTLNDDKQYNALPQVNDIDSLRQFIGNPDAYNDIYAKFRSHYGDIDVNIERTCEQIEHFVSDLPRNSILK